MTSTLIKKLLGLSLTVSILSSTAPLAFAETSESNSLNGHLSQQQASTGNTWSQASPATKIVTGTAAGATLGGATGLLTGLTMRTTSHHAMRMAKGTAAARGLAWGSVYGAGIGLLAGLGSAIFTPKPVAVSTVSTDGNVASR